MVPPVVSFRPPVNKYYWTLRQNGGHINTISQTENSPFFVWDYANLPNHTMRIRATNTATSEYTFTVSSIDRAFRSTFEAIAFLDDLTKHGIAFRSLEQHIDTRTLEGRKWYIDMANNAEYERGAISRRTREAMAAAKRRGRKFGQKPKLTPRQIRWARRELRKGKTKRSLARALRVHLSRALQCIVKD